MLYTYAMLSVQMTITGYLLYNGTTHNMNCIHGTNNLTYTECFATTPKASQNKHAVNNHRRNYFEVVLITVNTDTKHDHYIHVCVL